MVVPSHSHAPASPQRTPRAFSKHNPASRPGLTIQNAPLSPTLRKLNLARSPIWTLTSGNPVVDDLTNLSLDDPPTPTAETPKTLTMVPQHLHTSTTSNPSGHSGPSEPSERDFIIPLASDVIFFNLLTAALAQLSAFHIQQQEAFTQSVTDLCRSISSTIQPDTSPTVVAVPLTPSPMDDASLSIPQTSTALVKPKFGQKVASKKDLYAWREIFTLWIEHEIFESNAERDRGERSVEDAQARLQKFANEVVKRGLGDRRTLKGKKVRGAWDEFLRLNVLLLDIKRFQMANINAARK